MSRAKSWWGPRIWRILHSVAEITDRTDCSLLWRFALHATANMLPCAMCRLHFRAAIQTMRFPPTANIRGTLRHSLWAIHRDSGSADPVGEEELTSLYGGDRGTVLRLAQELVAEVAAGLRPVVDVGMEKGKIIGKVGAFEQAWHTLLGRLSVGSLV